MKIWGINKPYPTLSWWTNFMSGHINIGPITIWGANAMNWTVNIHTKRLGYICFTLPAIARFRRDRYTKKLTCQWYFYLSPNGTPWACTFYRGSDRYEKIRAEIRKLNFGHGYNSTKNYKKLRAINIKYEWLHVTEYDLERFKD